MWPVGQWEASKKIAWEGDIHIHIQTSQLLDRIGPEGQFGEKLDFTRMLTMSSQSLPSGGGGKGGHAIPIKFVLSCLIYSSTFTGLSCWYSPDMCKFCMKAGEGAPPPSAKMCKTFIRRDPYYSLHISEEGGGPPSENVQNLPGWWSSILLYSTLLGGD